MNCPRCSVNEIDPVSGRCDLCGFSVVAGVATESADVLSELAARQLAHEFVLAETLGRTEHSVVHRAQERATGRPVVVKVFRRRHREADVADGFRATMTALADIDHPNLVPVVRSGLTDSLCWYAIEDAGATPLHELGRHGPMDLRQVRRLVTQLAAALDHLHRRGIVHGAVRASNVLVERNGLARLLDLRVDPARRLTPPLPDAQRPAWIAPEEWVRGERWPVADEYALAVLIVELLTGRPVPQGMDPRPSLPEELPARVREALARALAPVPTQRYPGVVEFLWALEEGGGPIAAANRPSQRIPVEVITVRDWEPPPDPVRRWRVALRLAVALAVVGVCVVALEPLRDAFVPDPVPVTTAIRPTVPGERPRMPASSGSASAAQPSQASPVGNQVDRVEDARATRTAPAPTPAADNAFPAAVATGSPAAARSAAPAVRPSTIPAPPRQPGEGRLFVNAMPWGEVMIDGTSVGNTPRANLPIAAGSHVIRVRRPGFTTWERSVRVTTGDTLRFTDIVLTPVRQ